MRGHFQGSISIRHEWKGKREGKEKRNLKNIDEPISLPSKIGNIKRMLAGFKVRNMDGLYRPVLRAGHDTAIVKYDFDSSRRIMELFRVL